MTRDAPRSDLVTARRVRRRRIILVSVAIVVAVILGSGAAWAFDLFGEPTDGPAAVAHRTTTTTARDTGGAELRALGTVSTLADTGRPRYGCGSRATRSPGSLGPSLGEDHGRDRRRAARLRLARVEWAAAVPSSSTGRSMRRTRWHGSTPRSWCSSSARTTAASRRRSPQMRPVNRSGRPSTAARDRDARRVRERWEQRRAAAVYWVGAPTMQDRRRGRGRAGRERGRRAPSWRSVRARRYVDAYKLFRARTATTRPSFPARTASRYASAPATASTSRPTAGTCSPAEVFTPLDTRCDISGQAVPDEAKQPDQDEGLRRGPRAGAASGSVSPGNTAAHGGAGADHQPAARRRRRRRPSRRGSAPDQPDDPADDPDDHAQTTPTTPDTTSTHDTGQSSGSPSGPARVATSESPSL